MRVDYDQIVPNAGPMFLISACKRALSTQLKSCKKFNFDICERGRVARYRQAFKTVPCNIIKEVKWHGGLRVLNVDSHRIC